MHIDARQLDLQDLLKQLKEVLATNIGSEVNIEVLVSSREDARKVTGFVSMSGCCAKVDKTDNYYIIHVAGNICCA